MSSLPYLSIYILRVMKFMSDLEYRKIQGLVGDQSFCVVLPKKYAIDLGIGKGDFVKVYQEGEKIVMSGQLIMVFYSFSQSPPFIQDMEINSSNAIIGCKLLVTKGNEHPGKISMSLLLVTKFSVNKLQLPMVTTESSI
jgi:hypothetical protein